MEIILISKHHSRESFDCGVEALNNYLKRFAAKHTLERTGRTFVAVPEIESPEILGYYTLASGSVAFSVVPANLPHHPVPVVHLGRLAVSVAHQGKGIGEDLLIDALGRAARIEKEIAVYAVEVVAKDERAKRFYEKYGFTPLKDDPLHLYLPMKAILKLLL